MPGAAARARFGATCAPYFRLFPARYPRYPRRRRELPGSAGVLARTFAPRPALAGRQGLAMPGLPALGGLSDDFAPGPPPASPAIVETPPLRAIASVRSAPLRSTTTRGRRRRDVVRGVSRSPGAAMRRHAGYPRAGRPASGRSRTRSVTTAAPAAPLRHGCRHASASATACYRPAGQLRFAMLRERAVRRPLGRVPNRFPPDGERKPLTRRKRRRGRAG